ncbi:MAG: WecB/TagA/CpsF family glycosyltransferase [bacterium]
MRVTIYNVEVDNLTRDNLGQLLSEWLVGNEQKKIFTPNPEMILKTHNDPGFCDLLNQSDLSLPDGVGLCYAARALSDDVDCLHRHTGVDALLTLAKLCSDHDLALVLFGGDPGSAKASSDKLKERFPTLQCIDIYPGYVNIDQVNINQLDVIRRNQPAVLAVALGAGKQEKFIVDYLSSLPSVKIAIGVGGALEMIGGTLKRAPRLMRRAGLEWLWRVIIEPRRAGRIYNASIKFPIIVVAETVKRRRFCKACIQVIPEVMRQLFIRTK